MTTTLAGVPRVKATRTPRAKPLEAKSKREPDTKKKALKVDAESFDDYITNGWRKK